MPCDMLLLATVSPSGELPRWLVDISTPCFFLAFGLALLAAIIRLFWDSQRRVSTSLALAAFALALPLVAMVVCVQHFDFVALEMAGTKASNPLSTNLWVPCLPLEIALLVMLFHKRAPRQKAA